MKKYVLLTVTFLSNQAALLTPERYQAAVLNGAIGDALGFGTERIKSLSDIKKTFGQDGLTSLSQLTTKNRVIQYSDDTLMATIVLKTGIVALQYNLSVTSIIAELACQFGALFSPLYGTKVDPLGGKNNARGHGKGNIAQLTPFGSIMDKTTPIKLTSTPQKFCANCRDYRQALAPVIAERLDLSRMRTPQYIRETQSESGCGSLMRVWALALIYYNDLAKLATLAQQQSLLTHRNPLASAACVAMAIGTAHALSGEFGFRRIANEMVYAATRFDFQEQLYKIHAQKTNSPTRIDLQNNRLFTSDMILYALNAAQNGVTPEQFFGSINDKGDYKNGYRSLTGNILGWAADEAVAGAVYLFVYFALKIEQGEMSPAQAVKQAIIAGVNTPGDSDSIASLAGVLLGAYTGVIFDDPQIKNIENHDYLAELATLAYALVIDQKEAPVSPKVPQKTVVPALAITPVNTPVKPATPIMPAIQKPLAQVPKNQVVSEAPQAPVIPASTSLPIAPVAPVTLMPIVPATQNRLTALRKPARTRTQKGRAIKRKKVAVRTKPMARKQRKKQAKAAVKIYRA